MDCIEKQFLIKKAKELYPSWMESGHKEINCKHSKNNIFPILWINLFLIIIADIGIFLILN